MFTTEGSTQDAVFVIVLFGICDGPVSLLTDTICLPCDIVYWWNRKTGPNKKAPGPNPDAHGPPAPSPGTEP